MALIRKVQCHIKWCTVAGQTELSGKEQNYLGRNNVLQYLLKCRRDCLIYLTYLEIKSTT